MPRHISLGPGARTFCQRDVLSTNKYILGEEMLDKLGNGF